MTRPPHSKQVATAANGRWVKHGVMRKLQMVSEHNNIGASMISLMALAMSMEQRIAEHAQTCVYCVQG